MKKNIKISLILLIISIIIITIGIVLFLNNNENLTEVNYYCYMKSGYSKTVIIENTYEFTYNQNVKNPIRKFTATYKDSNEYKEENYGKFFIENDKPDKVENDDKNLKRTYIWNNGLSFDRDKDTIDSYIKLIESKGYKCTKK